MCSFSLIFCVNNAFIVPNKSLFYIHEYSLRWIWQEGLM